MQLLKWNETQQTAFSSESLSSLFYLLLDIIAILLNKLKILKLSEIIEKKQFAGYHY